MTWVVEFHPDFEPELVAGDKSGSSESLFYKQLIKTADTSLITITTAIETEPWGERFFQVSDPNGVVIQLVQWMIEPEQ